MFKMNELTTENHFSSLMTIHYLPCEDSNTHYDKYIFYK